MTAAGAAPAGPRVSSRNLDLKWSLTLRVVAVAFGCFLGAAALALYGTCRELRQANESVADIVVRQLQVQLFRIEASIDAPARFPDWEPVIDRVQGAGQCIRFVRPDGGVGRSSCVGVDRHSGGPPAWFATLVAVLPATLADTARPVSNHGRNFGTLVVTTEPAVVVAAIWKDVFGLLGLTALLVVAICLMQYVAISRALRPTQNILAGLDRLARGDLSCRLPQFRLIELQRISEVFNTLAASLERTTHERAALAARLVDGQEQERRHLARELHDELAQTLSAISAAAASIKVTAETECPALVPEASSLTQTSIAVMRSLRTTLQTLRPPEIDDFGLAAGLKTLVRDHERRAGGKLRILLEVDGDLGALPPTAASHVYRIVQEGLTNIARHADARRARVALALAPELPGPACPTSADADHRERWLRIRHWRGGGWRRARAGRHARARHGARRTAGGDAACGRFQAARRHPVRGARGGAAMSTVRVLLVDDHAVVRAGYRTLIEKHGLTVVGEAADAAAAYRCYKETRPDVVVMDISMPGRGGIDAIGHIRGLDPEARILVFTMHGGAAYALQAFRAGARGYVTKSSPPDLLVGAVRSVAEGRLTLCPEISEALALDRVEAETSGLDNLSPREFEIFRMILEARSTDDIAAALNVSRKTAANYHYAIKSKLGVASDIELLHLGLRHGLVQHAGWVEPPGETHRPDDMP